MSPVRPPNGGKHCLSLTANAPSDDGFNRKTLTPKHLNAVENAKSASKSLFFSQGRQENYQRLQNQPSQNRQPKIKLQQADK